MIITIGKGNSRTGDLSVESIRMDGAVETSFIDTSGKAQVVSVTFEAGDVDALQSALTASDAIQNLETKDRS